MNLSLNEFNHQVNTAILYLKENQTRLEFSSSFLADLEKDLSAWNKTFTHRNI